MRNAARRASKGDQNLMKRALRARRCAGHCCGAQRHGRCGTLVNGVIVAKDAKRKALVTVSHGSVRTVRAPNKFRNLRVGQRVAVKARMLTDGTYAAAAVRGQGRVSRVRFRGVVVRQDRRAGRLILKT